MIADLRRSIHIVSAIALLYMVTVGLDPLDPKPLAVATGGGDTARQIVYAAIFGIMLAAAPPWNVRRLLVLPFSILILLGWCWLSLSWAIDPAIALRRLALTSILIWMIFRIVDELGYRTTVTILRWSLAVLLAANFTAVIVSPAAIHYIPEPGDPNLLGDWRGLLLHKNFTGPICAFTIQIFAFDARRVPASVRIIVITAAATFLYFTGSKTSIVLAAIALMAGFLYRLYNPGYRILLIPLLLVLGVFCAIWFDSHWDTLATPLYSDSALTGRGRIWRLLFSYAADHPLLGAGYGSFWNIGDYSPVYQYGTGWVATIYAGHSGYFDLLVTIGIPGLLLAVLTMFVLPGGKLLVSSTVPRPRGAMLAGLLLFCAGHNVTESTLLERDMIVQVFLVLTIALIIQVCRSQSRHKPAAGRKQSWRIRKAPAAD